MTKFLLDISYLQLAVFDSQLVNPFNDWSARHVAQGFSWRPGSVSFATIDPVGTIEVDVAVATEALVVASDAIRIVVVPFVVATHGEVEVASIGSSAAFETSAGDYELVFEHGRNTAGLMWAKLTFRRVNFPINARIVRAEYEVNSDDLVMTADPA